MFLEKKNSLLIRKLNNIKLVNLLCKTNIIKYILTYSYSYS